MRGLAVLLLIALMVPGAALSNDAKCFGPGRAWCAWTVFESRPQDGWGVANRARLPALVVETIVDAPGNIPRFAVRVSPVPVGESARVVVSLRRDEHEPHRWRNFAAMQGTHDGMEVFFVLSRGALEALFQAPDRATLYIFAEVAGGVNNHKVSHKVTLEGLREALRFARLGP